MIVSRCLLNGFLVIALTMSVLVHQVENTTAMQRPSPIENLLQQAVIIGKRTVDFLFRPRLIIPKNFLGTKIGYNAMLNGFRKRNLARRRLTRKRMNVLRRMNKNRNLWPVTH